MNLDIVKAWKNQTYRQSLGSEEMIALPVHPAGELMESDLASVRGGDGGPFGIAGTAASRAVSEDIHVHSFGVTCDTNIFSAAQLATLTGAINILSTIAQICANND